MIVLNGIKNVNLTRSYGNAASACGDPYRTYNMRGLRISATEGVPPGSTEKWMMPLDAFSPSGGGASVLQGDDLQGDDLQGDDLQGDWLQGGGGLAGL